MPIHLRPSITRFRAAASPKGIAASVQAVAGWAIAVEAFTNLAWSVSVAEKDPSKILRDFEERQLENFRSAVGDAIACLGSLAGLPTDFLHGKYETWYVDE